MKKSICLMILISLIFIPFSYANWFYNSRNVFVHVSINSDAEIVRNSPSGYINSATINLTFFPKDMLGQELVKYSTNPLAEITDDSVKFSWKNPPDTIGFGFDADVKTTNTVIPIRKKINFPIEDLPEDAAAYTRPSKTIDSDNEDIIKTASELVKGEDDLYSAVFKLASWTKNDVNYNLSTLSAKITQKASGVLKSRQGVCSDISSLFIAVARSVGIPARFVSGVAYTNSELFPEHWGPHGWAEVYFPGYGWVPFDPTYGEYGWIDPTHIKFKDSVDSDEPSTYYQWLGRNADLITKSLEIKTDLIDKTGYMQMPINVNAYTLKKAISFGSYNLVEADVENTADYYYSTELYLIRPKEARIVDEDFKSILLLPGEKKTVFWILKLNDNLDSRYSYTFPIIAATINNITSETSFTSTSRDTIVSFDEVQQAAKLLEEEKEKKYSGNVILNCKPSKEEFYQNEDAKIFCTAKNTGNIFLSDVIVCFESKCSAADLGISQIKDFRFEINKSAVGQKEMPVTLRNEIVSKSSYVSYKIDDEPKIEIEEIKLPSDISYGRNFTISFMLAKKSISNPKNVQVVFRQNGIDKKWLINELAQSREYVLDLEASQLNYGENKYKVSVNYKDGLNKQYNIKKEFSLNFTNVTLLQRLLLSINGFENLNNEYVAIMLLTGTIVFIGVVIWLFRRGRKD